MFLIKDKTTAIAYKVKTAKNPLFLFSILFKIEELKIKKGSLKLI